MADMGKPPASPIAPDAGADALKRHALTKGERVTVTTLVAGSTFSPAATIMGAEVTGATEDVLIVRVGEQSSRIRWAAIAVLATTKAHPGL